LFNFNFFCQFTEFSVFISGLDVFCFDAFLEVVFVKALIRKEPLIQPPLQFLLQLRMLPYKQNNMENKEIGKNILGVPEPNHKHRNQATKITKNRVLKIQNVLNLQ
jgi:hypothetical protein